MTENESLYIRTLLWAYDQGEKGFTMAELKLALGVNLREGEWIEWMFTNGLNGEAPLVWYMPVAPADGGVYTYYLTASGSSAAIDYRELKEAQKSGERATVIAFVAIFISIVVGLAQIYFDAFYEKAQANPNIPTTTTPVDYKG